MFKKIKRWWNTRQIKINSLKAEIYDLKQEIGVLRIRLKSNNEMINKIKNLSKEDKKKFDELIGEDNDGKGRK